ncbi:2'-5' RNA ligase [Mariprofundus ferrinatatus]|uniref:RNA 2',3'-cyclic phosphodiesterase n=1 Tax=Mariprofundus ferrinatatus TaxID=1921087 RepID=A0A2K8L393_9PROT|nr:RNA 2',3'-cyclic phosphodiesterase [Mariprofundus ferrinatatus]ATX81747.1 2'-5' RNA ligase [Mariprofundus ferrinatatus]
MRLFAGIELPSNITDQLTLWWESERGYLDPDHWRPVAPHLWHLTLAFYGEVSGGDVDDLAEELAECSRNAKALTLKTGNFGFFPRASKPRVFWVGVDEAGDGDGLKHLARCCRRAGHATVRKRTATEAPFRGHITVARVRGHAALPDMEQLQMMADVPVLDWGVQRINLYQSILRPEGPQYRRLETFELNGSSNRTRGKYV